MIKMDEKTYEFLKHDEFEIDKVLSFLDENIEKISPEFPRTDSWFEKGGFSFVYHSKLDEKNVVVKLYLCILPEIEEGFSKLYFHDMDLLELDHPSLMKVYKIIKNEGQVQGLVCEDCGIKTLYDLVLRKRIKENLIEEFSMIPDIIEGISYLLSKDFSHGDLKDSNITTNPVKLIDFDLICKLGIIDRKELFATPKYCGPEVFCGKIENTGDIYNLGSILYKIIEGNTPHEDSYSGEDMVFKKLSLYHIGEIVEKQYFKNEEFMYERELTDLIQEMLSPSPGARPNIVEVKLRYDSWLNDYLKRNEVKKDE